MRWCLGSRCSPCLGGLRCRGRLWLISDFTLSEDGGCEDRRGSCVLSSALLMSFLVAIVAVVENLKVGK